MIRALRLGMERSGILDEVKLAGEARSGGYGERLYRNIVYTKPWASHVHRYTFDQDLCFAPVDNSVPFLVSVPGIVDPC